MNTRLRRILTARPVDLPIYRQYVVDHPKHAATALLLMLPWSVTIGVAALVFIIGFWAGATR